MRQRSSFFRLCRRSPELAKERLRGVLRASGGNVRASARVLGISKRSTNRWIATFGLRPELELIRKESGWSSFYWWHPDRFVTARRRLRA